MLGLRGEEAAELISRRADPRGSGADIEPPHQLKGAEAGEGDLKHDGDRQKLGQDGVAETGCGGGRRDNRRVEERGLNVRENRHSAIGVGIPQRERSAPEGVRDQRSQRHVDGSEIPREDEIAVEQNAAMKDKDRGNQGDTIRDERGPAPRLGGHAICLARCSR